jgi:hypothetical protein
MRPSPGVLIDACIPRTSRERCNVLFDYLVAISEVGPHQDSDPNAWPDDSDWSGFEDGLLDRINEKLPNELVCTLGEFQPGDVVIREVGPDDADTFGVPYEGE